MHNVIRAAVAMLPILAVASMAIIEGVLLH